MKSREDGQGRRLGANFWQECQFLALMLSEGRGSSSFRGCGSTGSNLFSPVFPQGWLRKARNDKKMGLAMAKRGMLARSCLRLPVSEGGVRLGRREGSFPGEGGKGWHKYCSS